MRISSAFALSVVLAGGMAGASHAASPVLDKAPNCTEDAQCYRDYVKYFMTYASVFKLANITSSAAMPQPIVNAYNDSMAVAQLREWATKPEKYPKGEEAIKTVCAMSKDDLARFSYLKGRLTLSEYGKTEFEIAVAGMEAIDRVFGVMGEKENPCGYLINRLSSGRLPKDQAEQLKEQPVPQ